VAAGKKKSEKAAKWRDLMLQIWSPTGAKNGGKRSRTKENAI
jgi:hypothetical protein